MESKKLYSLKNLAKKLKRLLRRYNQVYDFIIFGSSVKDKMIPKDVDIAVISSSKDVALVGDIKTSIDKDIKNAHVQVIVYEDFLKSKFPYHAVFEGFSVKAGAFPSRRLDLKKKVMYTFNLSGLSQSQKVMLNKGLRSLIKSTKSEKVGKGAVLVPVNSAGEFEDFFSQWKRISKKKELIEM